MSRIPIYGSQVPTQQVRPVQGRSPRNANASDFGGDMNLGNLGRSISGLAGALAERQEQQDMFEANKILSEEGMRNARDFDQRVENAPLGAANFTEDLNQDYADRRSQVLDQAEANGMSSKARKRLELGLMRQQASAQNKAITFQSRSHGAKVASEVSETTTNMAQTASLDPGQMDELMAAHDQMVDEIPELDAVNKQKLKDMGREQIRVSAGLGLANRAPSYVIDRMSADGGGIGRPVVAQDLPAEAKALLRAIGSVEAQDYDIRNGGGKFDPMGGHPGINPGPGGESSASGRYQFIRDTWNTVASANGFSDMSPANQDKGAWWLAQQDYRARTGRDLLADLQTGELALIRRTLGGKGKKDVTWEGLQHLTDAQFEARMRGGVSKPKDGKTGDPILDALTVEERTRVLNAAYTSRNRQSSENRAALSRDRANSEAAYLSGTEYEGRELTQFDFQQAYPDDPIRAEAEWQSHEYTRQVGTAIQDMGTMSSAEIRGALASLDPRQDTSSLTFAEDMKTYAAAQQAASAIVEQRQTDPVTYVATHFPDVQGAEQGVRQALDTNGDVQDAVGGLMAAQDAAYDTLGIPGFQRQYMTPALKGKIADVFDSSEVPLAQKVQSLMMPIMATDDPARQRQMFEEIAQSDPEMAKFQSAVEAYSEGRRPAAMRLFRAAVLDPSELPGGLPNNIKPAEISQEIANEIMAPGKIGDAFYGLSAGMSGEMRRATRDRDLLDRAVRFRIQTGEDVGDAVANAAKDVYGDVQVVETDNVVAPIPSGADPTVFSHGLRSYDDRLRQVLTSNITENAALTPGQQAQQSLEDEIAVENILANGEWRAGGDGYVFVDTLTGLPVGVAGRPFVLSFEEAMTAGAGVAQDIDRLRNGNPDDLFNDLNALREQGFQ